ncbi:MAG: cupin domain-containing protein [Coprobacillaceae bacterium]
MEALRIITTDEGIAVTKENQTKVLYYLFDEYEIHLNIIPPNSIQEWHYHSNIEEVILVTKGILTCKWIEDKKEYTKDIQANQLVQVKNAIHTFENKSNEEVTFIAFRLVLDGENKRELIKNDKIIIEK